MAKRPFIDLTSHSSSPFPSSVQAEEPDNDAAADATSDLPRTPMFENQQGLWEYRERQGRFEHLENNINVAVDAAVSNKNEEAEEAAPVKAESQSADVRMALAKGLDKMTININMDAGYSGAPVINFNIYALEPKGKKRACEDENHVNCGRKKQLRKSVDKDVDLM